METEGLYVKKMGGGQVNTATGDFVFEVEEGYRIQNGNIKGMVKGANLLGNGPNVLTSIDRVGNDLGWGLGTCGKEGQGVPAWRLQSVREAPNIRRGHRSESRQHRPPEASICQQRPAFKQQVKCWHRERTSREFG